MEKNYTAVSGKVQLLLFTLFSLSFAMVSPTRAHAAGPEVVSVSPANGATGVSITSQVTVIFSENMSAVTINSSTFELRGNGNSPVPAIIIYNATLRQAILTPSVVLSNSNSYKAFIKGGKNGVKDVAGNTMAGNYSWSFTTVAAPDITPPAIKSVQPGDGATGVSINTVVSAKFTEDMDAGTITASTFELRNGANALVPAAITYNGAARKATLTPLAPLSYGVVYTAKITGGSSGVKDLAGNALAADYTWNFTTPFTIFQPTDVPAIPVTTDLPVEVGVKFTTTQNGKVLGIRFYKGAGNDGTHTGHLWSSAGTMLAEATFSNETVSGWQEVFFTSPVSISAGEVYTASYFSSSGKYGFTNSYFTTTIINGPIRALSDAEAGGNGVFSYSALPVFPVSSYDATNYFVDVLFASGADNSRIYVSAGNNSTPAVLADAAKRTDQISAGNKVKGPATIAGTLYIRAMPNPSTGYYNLVINSQDAQPVTVRIMDISGRMIETYQSVASSTVLKLGHNWKAGYYFAEVVQGNTRKMMKLIKIN